MNYQLRTILRSAYEEHMSRRNMRRILPRTVHKSEHTGLPHSELDRLLILWFDGKCKQDKSWCSWQQPEMWGLLTGYVNISIRQEAILADGVKRAVSSLCGFCIFAYLQIKTHYGPVIEMSLPRRQTAFLAACHPPFAFLPDVFFFCSTSSQLFREYVEQKKKFPA